MDVPDTMTRAEGAVETGPARKIEADHDAAPYDIIVIGAGSGGLGVAGFMAKAGLRTLLIDRSDESIGGDCLNYGCVPSKALIHVANTIHRARLSSRYGMDVSGEVDIELVERHIREAQSTIRTHENAAYLRDQGMDVALGNAFFVSESEVMVNGVRYGSKRIVIATGSRPRQLKVPGIDAVERYTNESIFQIGHVPKRLVVFGGGPVGVEIGQAFQRLGSQVILVHKGDRLLPHDDARVSSILQRRLEDEGMKFIMNAEPVSFPDAKSVSIKTSDGANMVLALDAIFIAIGREPALDELHLERAGIEVKDGNIVHDRRLRTTNPRVFLCGDIAGEKQFSHAAEQHMRLLLNNFFSPLKKKLDDRFMSWVTFTDPQVATFGMSKEQLVQKGIAHRTVSTDFEQDDRAVIEKYRDGLLVLHTSKGLFRRQRILGGTMVAPQAGEMVQELILVMQEGLSIDRIFNKIYPYPVASRVNQLVILQQKEKMLKGPMLPLMRVLYRLWS